MTDQECVQFLQWALPQLGYRWAGFRKVRRQVCRRLRGRMDELGLSGAAAYIQYLASHPSEWGVLDGFCRITISRLFRNRAVFKLLAEVGLPRLGEAVSRAGRTELRAWSAGCASGEEPYSLALLWRLQVQPRFPDLDLSILATDADEALLQRAAQACYGRSSLRELPPEWLDLGFEPAGPRYCLREEYRRGVRFQRQDIRREWLEGPFDLILCRNLVFTYFDTALCAAVGRQIAERLNEGGLLLVGYHEQLPPGMPELRPWPGRYGLYQKCANGTPLAR
ncbi:MAG: hypothetical protein KatS3mg123_0299 [Burkholderiales bacterium]|nr:MAG: hypothetical protein KatS3mg123_0299 [Burkholderiales bacterium]